jgi:hypothetical protein
MLIALLKMPGLTATDAKRLHWPRITVGLLCGDLVVSLSLTLQECGLLPILGGRCQRVLRLEMRATQYAWLASAGSLNAAMLSLKPKKCRPPHAAPRMQGPTSSDYPQHDTKRR